MVNETKVRISLTDAFSGGMQRINSTVNTFGQRLQKSGASMQGFSASMQGSVANVRNLETSLKSADAVFQRLIYSTARYLVIYQGLQGLGNAWDNIIGGAYRYGKMLETNTIGVAGILTSMTNLRGEQLKWNEAMGISTSIMKKLQSEALRTAATSQDLMEVFQAILGPGLASGMNVDEIVKLSTVGVNAVKSLGLPHNQLVQELRDLVQGGIRPASSTLATALGLKDADITAAKQSSEGLFKFLMRRLEGFDKSVGATSESVAGRLARIEEGLQVGLFKGGDELYKFYSEMLGGVADNLILIKEKTDATGKTFKSWEINPDLINFSSAFSHDLTEALKSIKEIGKLAAGPLGIGVKTLGSGLSFAANNLGKIAAGFAVYKGAKWITDILNVVNGKGLFTGSTAIGKFFNVAFYEPFTSAGKQLQSLIRYQDELNAHTEEYMAIMSQHGSIESVLKNNATSVYNLAKTYEQLGIDAKTAADMQRRAIENLKDMAPANFDKYLADQHNYAEAFALRLQQDKAKNEAGSNISGAKSRVMREMANQKSAYSNLISGSRTEESVLNLAKAYERLGMSAEQASVMQKKVQDLVLAGDTKRAEEVMSLNAQDASRQEMLKKREVAIKQLYKTEFAGIDATIGKLKEQKAYENAKANLAKRIKDYTTNEKFTKYNKENLQAIVNAMQEANISIEQQSQIISKYTTATKSGGKKAMEELKNQIIETFGRINSGMGEIMEKTRMTTQATKEWLSVDYGKMTADQLKILEFDAQHILNLSQQKTQVELVQNAFNTLKQAQAEGYLTANDAERVRIDLLKQVATGYVDVASKIAEEINLSYQAGQLNTSYAGDVVAKKLAEAQAIERVVAMDAKEIAMQDRKLLEVEAVRKVRLTADNEAIENLKRVIANEQKLEETMTKRGLSTVESSTIYINLLKEIASAQDVVVASKIKDVEITQQQTEARLGSTAVLGKAISKTASLAFATSMLGETLLSATDSENGLAKELVSGVSVFAQFTMSVGMLSDALEGMTAKAILAKASLVGVIVTAAAAIAYKVKSDYDNYTKGGKANYDPDTGQTWVDPPEGQSPEEIAERVRKETEERARKAEQDALNLSLKNPPKVGTPSGGGGGSAVDQAAKEAEKAQRKYEEQVRQINDLNAELAKKVLEQTGTTAQIEYAKLAEELEKYKSKISKAEAQGVDTKSAVAKLGEYELQATKKLKEKEIEDKHKLDMDYINTRQQMNVYSVDQANALRLNELESYRAYLESRLEDTALNAEKRLEIEKKLAETIKEQEQQSAYDYSSAWENAINHIKEKRYDLQNTLESGMDNFADTLSNFGQNMLTSTESFATQVDNLFKDLANSIYNTMMKVFMQGLVSQMLGSVFGGSMGIGTTKNVTSGMTIGGMKPSVFSAGSGTIGTVGSVTQGLSITPHFASGGYASGWALVGERGPELVNFSQPGRVYNSEQTSKALNGGIENVRVVIENKSGQEVKATQTNTQFNAKEMVIGIVIDAVSRNDGGINNILKGAIA